MANPASDVATYPANYEDTSNSWPAFSASDPIITTGMNRIRNSILAIQKELGLNPKGAYPTLADRLVDYANVLTYAHSLSHAQNTDSHTSSSMFTINEGGYGIFGENDFLRFQDMNVATHGVTRHVALGWNQDLEVMYVKRNSNNFANFKIGNYLSFENNGSDGNIGFDSIDGGFIFSGPVKSSAILPAWNSDASSYIGDWDKRFLNVNSLMFSSPIRPDESVTFTAFTNDGAMATGTYRYAIVGIDAAGNLTNNIQSGNISVTGPSGRVAINFTMIPGAVKYNIYRSSNGGSTWGRIVSGAVPSHNLSGATFTYSGTTVTYVDGSASNGPADTPPSTSNAYAIRLRQTNSPSTFSYISAATNGNDDMPALVIAGGAPAYANHARSLLRIESGGGTYYTTFGTNNYGRNDIFSSHGLEFNVGSRGFGIYVARFNSGSVEFQKPVYNNSTTLGFSSTSSSTHSILDARQLRFRVPSGDEGNSGTFGYRTHDSTSLCIIGCGTSGSNRLIRLWDCVGIGTAASTAFSLQTGGSINIANAGGIMYINNLAALGFSTLTGALHVGDGFAYSVTSNGLSCGTTGSPNGNSLYVKGLNAENNIMRIEWFNASQTGDFLACYDNSGNIKAHITKEGLFGSGGMLGINKNIVIFESNGYVHDMQFVGGILVSHNYYLA